MNHDLLLLAEDHLYDISDTSVYSATSRMVMNIVPMERFPLSYAYEHPNFDRALSPQHRVRAATRLPINASTEVMEETDILRSNAPDDLFFSIGYGEGQLYCIDNPLRATYWLKLITLANNIQSENVILVQVDRGVTLKIIKEIFPGEPLMLWFDTPLLSKMNIPLYLQPHCMIETDQTPSYRCHLCYRLFSDPNPLKIHIALECNKFNKNDLWNKLAKGLNQFPQDNFYIQLQPAFQYQTPSFQHQTKMALHSQEVETPWTRVNSSQKHYSSTSTMILPPVETPATATASTETLTSSSDKTSQNTSINSSLERQKSPIIVNASVNSAFKPYTKQRITKTFDQNYQKIISYNKMMYNYSSQINALLQGNHRGLMPLPNITSEIQAAQLETIISNLGKSKDGHHCLYCNRIYSRKYGLKIHIRTHTGYKPLKCKICFRPFGDPSNLNKHVRLHAEGGETPYKCDLCDKVLVRRRDLERHIKSRHPDNSYISTSSPKSQ